jgi:signal transduction histidine kinase
MAEGAEAMGFCAEASKRCVHVGSITAVGEVGSAAVVDLGASCDELQALFSGFEVPGRGLVRAPAGLEALWRRGAGSTPERPVWVLPVLNGPEVFGAVLVAAEDERIHRTEQAADAWKALATAVGLALTSAKARIDAERMTEELLATNRRLDAAQKELVDTRSMSMIAEMAAGAAHELNNPLAVVSGRAQMALKTCGDEELARTFRIIVEQTERATNIVADLMGFAKPEAPQPVERAIVEVLEPRCQHWRGRAKLESEALSVTVADRTATVYADPAQLCCALDAVLANAVEAIAGTDARVVVNSPSRASDETVRIVVEDNGVGMTREVLAHATDPFYSNRKAGRGRGLGLSLAYRLIEINGGRLRLRSTPGAGTTVTIELPARAPDP